MKSSDIALIIVIATVSVVASFLVIKNILGDPNEMVETVEYMDVISSEISAPDNETFNSYAYNPTVEVYTGKCAADQVWDKTRLACVDKDGELHDAIDADGEDENNKDKQPEQPENPDENPENPDGE